VSKFFVYTFGCRCNQADSAAIREGLCRNSLQEVESPLDAQLVVVNTCTVTHRTDQQVRQTVRKVHRENPGARLVVTGCYAERDPQSIAAIPGVNLVIGNADKERLAEIVSDKAPQSCGKVIRTPLDAARDYLLPSMRRTGGKTRPFVKIQDGCDARCSYCIIPVVRGPGRSAQTDDVLTEVKTLIAGGYQEIVLTGVHLGTYGRKLATPASLAELLRRILQLPGLGRLRLSSIEPMRFSREIVDLAVRHRSFAPHFHIPLQSGCDHILRSMRRPYTAARFFDLLRHIEMKLPSAAIGTDVIVGFPGETDKDFEETVQLVRAAPLSYFHIFPFSAREGTPAYSMSDAVPARVIRERACALRELSREKNLAFRRRFVDRVLPALTLAKEEEMGESLVLTENYIHARIAGLKIPPNRLVDVRIVDVQPEGTAASIVS
jgi:threonylcarbamoyladenosine tRNA methylthiotransferase MtaB